MGSIFFLDAWPFITLTLVVASPATLAQTTTEYVLPKFPAIRDFLYPLSNGKDIVGMDGPEWKYWRSVFNPGFSANYLMKLVPDIVKETTVFCKILQRHAEKQDTFQMKSLTDNLAMDVIGRVVLDSNLNCQRKNNYIVDALRRQMRWMAFGSEGNPMDRHISPEVDARFKMHKNANKGTETSSSEIRRKSVIDLALLAYLKGNPNTSSSEGIDPVFKEIAMNQMKLFLFSGHDTTSSTVCYVLYLISIHPLILSRVRTEHDNVLGPSPSQAAARISEDPYLLNQLPYTTAVIKESMRLFPAASTTRRGEPGFKIVDPRNGLRYPADPSTLIWLVSHACQRDPAFWPRADEFLPERWMTREGEELFPQYGAWRPFELGPRACIGRERSMIELKIVLCLVARSFELSVAYKEVDAEDDRNKRTLRNGRVRDVNGERAYQVGKGEPSGFLPCKIKEI